MKLIYILTLTTGLAFTMQGFAHESECHKDHPKKGGHQKLRKHMKEKFDANKDGKLDENEKAEMKKAWQDKKAKFVKKFDTNGDGQLDESEKAAAKQEHERKRAEIIQKFDQNGDGKLDGEERKAAKEYCKQNADCKD